MSGVVTVNGEPRANIRVVYAPMATEETSNVGLPSLGITDASGRYQLKTKDGHQGVVPGRHTVTFNYDDLEHMGDLKIWLGSAESAEDAAAAQAKIDHVESELKIRGAIAKSAKQIVTVPEEGNSKADFEVGEEKE